MNNLTAYDLRNGPNKYWKPSDIIYRSEKDKNKILSTEGARIKLVPTGEADAYGRKYMAVLETDPIKSNTSVKTQKHGTVTILR